MIKKIMISAADNKESILPQSKKKGDVQGQESAAKGLFGSLLQSMQANGEVANTSEANKDAGQGEGNSSANQQTKEEKDSSQSLIENINGTVVKSAAGKTVALAGKNIEGKQSQSGGTDQQSLISKLNDSKSKQGAKEGQATLLEARKSMGQQSDVSTEGKEASEAVANNSAGKANSVEGESPKPNAANKQSISAGSLLSRSKTTVEGAKRPKGNAQNEGQSAGNVTAGQQTGSKAQPSQLITDLAGSKNGKEINAGNPATSGNIEAKIEEAQPFNNRLAAPQGSGERISIQKNGSNTVGATMNKLRKRLEQALRKKGAAVSSANAQSASERGESSQKASEEQKKIFHNALAKGKATTPLEKSLGIRELQVSQAQKKEEKKRLPSFANREERAEVAGSSNTESKRKVVNPGKLNAFSPSSFSNTSNGATGGLDFTFEKDKMVWNEHTAESVEAKEAKGTEQGSSAHMKLGQVSVSNMSVRRKIMPGLTQTTQQAAGKAKEAPETWQKHNFVLDDGKEIHLSARQVKGVLQLKLGSLQSDLNRLLQQHQQQIKEHLEQECGTDIDLQFDNDQQQEMAGFFDDSSSSGHGRGGSKQFGREKVIPQQVDQVLLKSVRSFGYNQMEWTA